LNTTSWTAELVQAYFPPDDLLSKSQGSTQVLPGGNVLVGWGSEGAVTEFTADGTPIFHAYMDSGALGEGVENYRAFRYNWTGLPSEDPAIVALKNDKGTTVYVSWNGDTETAIWRFYSVSDDGKERQSLGEVERKSFETSLQVPDKHLIAVVAESIDASGIVLTSTSIVRSEDEILPPTKHTDTLGPIVSTNVGTQKSLTGESMWERFSILKLVRLRFNGNSEL
jgi:hypothetical protein